MMPKTEKAIQKQEESKSSKLLECYLKREKTRSTAGTFSSVSDSAVSSNEIRDNCELNDGNESDSFDLEIT